MLGLALLLLVPPPAQALEGGYVTRVIDGDTMDIRIGIETIRVRLADVDAPELSRPRCAHERDLAQRARDLVQRATRETAVSVERFGRDQYRRTVALVRVADRRGATSVGDILIREGLGVTWNGGRGVHPNPWCG